MNDGEVLIHAEHVSKKFCRSLKRSLWYGAQDVASALLPWQHDGGSPKTAEDVGFAGSVLRKDEFWAVRDVSFEVRRGECLGLIGHNGAGKSTLLKILNSLNRPDLGRITLKGRVGALIELSAGFNPVLSGRENIFNQAALLGFSKKETLAKFDEIVEFSELEDFLEMPVQNFSSGMRVRLGFAIAAVAEPDILLLDEVLAVGDIGFQIKCYNKINELADRCATIFVSHTMPQVAKVCTALIVLKGGMVAYQGRNVKEGIGVYYSQFQGFQTYIRERKLLRVSDLRARSPAIQAEDGSIVIKHGDNLGIDIEMQGEVEAPQKVSLVLKILDQSFIPVVNSETPRFEFARKISFQLSNLLLTPGSYSLDLYALVHNAGSEREEVVSYYKSFKTLRVTGEMVENHACFQMVPEIRNLAG